MTTSATPRPVAKLLTGGDLATRMTALDWSVIGSQLLPNPDLLLRQAGKQIAAYRELTYDSHVGACIRRRKSAVKALDWGLDRGQAPSRVNKAVADALAALDMQRIVGQALDAVLYGYAPMEITWRAGPGGIFPADVQAKPPEWFGFDTEGLLRFKTKANPVFGEEVPYAKFLLPRQDPTYQNPYGFADLSLCWWPVLFKKGGMRFWLSFAEKYGGAFAIGKLPRGASEPERNEMLQALEAMLQDAVATIPDDGSVSLLEAAGKASSADLYERLALHCRGEISIVLTGTNQTVEASSNKASAHAGLDVAEDLRDSGAAVVAAAVNQLIAWMVELNWPGAAAPVFSMWDQQAQDELQAQRDKSNYDAGARFTNAYWMRGYGYQEGDLAAPAASPPLPLAGEGRGEGAAGATAFAEAALAAAADAAADPTAAELDALAEAGTPAWAALIEQVQAVVDRAPDLAAAQRALATAYAELDTADLVKLMSAAFALAELKGIAAARADSQ